VYKELTRVSDELTESESKKYHMKFEKILNLSFTVDNAILKKENKTLSSHVATLTSQIRRYEREHQSNIDKVQFAIGN